MRGRCLWHVMELQWEVTMERILVFCSACLVSESKALSDASDVSNNIFAKDRAVNFLTRRPLCTGRQ